MEKLVQDLKRGFLRLAETIKTCKPCRGKAITLAFNLYFSFFLFSFFSLFLPLISSTQVQFSYFWPGNENGDEPKLESVEVWVSVV